MTIKVACQCGKRFVAPPHFAGKRVPCPSCGAPIPIAAPPAKSAPAAVPAGGIVVACGCGQKFKAPEHLGGKQVPCPVCQQQILIPAAALDDPFGPLPDSPAVGDDLWNSLPQQPAWPPPQPVWQQPVYSPPAQDFQAAHHASLAQHYIASAHHQNVEQQSDMDAWGTGKIFSGILMMTIAFIWFFGGLLVGIIFFFPPVLFIAGLVALINGVLQKVNR